MATAHVGSIEHTKKKSKKKKVKSKSPGVVNAVDDILQEDEQADIGSPTLQSTGVLAKSGGGCNSTGILSSSFSRLSFIEDGIEYADYVDESMLSDIQALVSRDLSEPYSVFTYRYFLHNWPSLCICAYAMNEQDERSMIGTIVCKGEDEREGPKGYIAMLAVNKEFRKRGIGMKLASIGIERMVAQGCEEIGLEAEASNAGALGLYAKLGFMRDEKLTRYYLNGGDAYRLKLWVDVCAEDQPAPHSLSSVEVAVGVGGADSGTGSSTGQDESVESDAHNCHEIGAVDS